MPRYEPTTHDRTPRVPEGFFLLITVRHLQFGEEHIQLDDAALNASDVNTPDWVAPMPIPHGEVSGKMIIDVRRIRLTSGYMEHANIICALHEINGIACALQHG
jgi:hypothetical protein